MRADASGAAGAFTSALFLFRLTYRTGRAS
jgi:hypothetical protein